MSAFMDEKRVDCLDLLAFQVVLAFIILIKISTTSCM